MTNATSASIPEFGGTEVSEEQQLEAVMGPAVVVRVMPETGPSVTVEYAQAPTPGEVIVVAEALLKACAPTRFATGGVISGDTLLKALRP